MELGMRIRKNQASHNKENCNDNHQQQKKLNLTKGTSPLCPLTQLPTSPDHHLTPIHSSGSYSTER